jgi:hypothetical protein
LAQVWFIDVNTNHQANIPLPFNDRDYRLTIPHCLPSPGIDFCVESTIVPEKYIFQEIFSNCGEGLVCGGYLGNSREELEKLDWWGGIEVVEPFLVIISPL